MLPSDERVRPTRALWAALAGGVALLALSAARDDAWLLLLAGLVLALPLVALLFLPRSPSSVCWEGPERVRAGSGVRHRLHVHAPAGRRTPAVEVALLQDGASPAHVVVPPLEPGGRAEVDVDRVALARGSSRVLVVLLSATDPLGMLRRTRSLSVEHPLVVHPLDVPVVVPPPPPAGGEGAAGAVARGAEDVHALREFRPGDTASAVSWRATARHGRLVVVERDRPPRPRVAVVAGDPTATGEAEGVLALAAAAAVRCAEAGRPTALVVRCAAGPVLVQGTALELLDAVAAVRELAPVDAGLLTGAVEWAGPGGDVLVAGAVGGAAGVWSGAAGARGGTRVLRLRPAGTGATAAPGPAGQLP